VTILDIATANLLSPIVLSFALGAIAAWLRSDLHIPEQIYAALSIYLLFAIGLKGGVELANTPLRAVAGPIAGALLLGLAIPLWSYAVLRGLLRLGVPDAAAIAAHYGSVSAVTFIAALAYLDRIGVAYEGFAPALLAIMEVPAIIVALALAQRHMASDGAWSRVLAEIATGRSVVLLAGGLLIGWLVGPRGFASVKPFFVDLFAGVLCLFLLDLGLAAARRIRDFRKVGWQLAGFALVAPPIHALVAILVGKAVGLSQGGAMVLGTLAASASYIAAPAAVRLALPDASPAYYLTMAVAITFPFNLTVGLPLYHWLASLVFA
jgi:uncharacterized protein